MKKAILFTLILVVFSNSYSQKKKKETQKGNEKGVFAKADNLIAEVKKGNFQVTINENGKEKDALIIKQVGTNFVPTNTKITAFKANGTPLYLVTWTEKNNTKTNLKNEDIVTINNVVYEISSKKQVFSNTQTTNNITEKVFLDKGKTASETQQKVQHSGFEFALNQDGTLSLKTKTASSKKTYNATKFEFEESKK